MLVYDKSLGRFVRVWYGIEDIDTGEILFKELTLSDAKIIYEELEGFCRPLLSYDGSEYEYCDFEIIDLESFAHE